MRFEWDEEKRVSNWRKHRVDFDYATVIFFELFSATSPDRIVDGEVGWRTTGNTPKGSTLVVIHTSRFDGDEEITRIISARKANPHEQRDYSQGRDPDMG